MKVNKKLLQGFLGGIIITSFIFIAQSGIGAVVNLKPIKPTANQAPQSDEQQAILAVRTAKASIVNIVGNTPGNPDGLTISVSTIDGTGFIIDSEGYIVSNNHVVSDPNINYNVVFADGTTFPAKVLGLDKYNDVALLKIDAHNLPVAKLGDSDGLETGQTVFAIGNSLGKYQNTVTKGVVSGLGRSIDENDVVPGQPRLQNLIQTDASINLGNSGGPLINLAGEVIGMNTLIDTGGESLGFAIPMKVVKNSVDQLKAFGKVSKPYVGVNFLTITPAQQILRNLKISDGALVASVAAGSPAERAGIKAGDVITEINHEKLNQKNELDAIVSKYYAGNQVLITFMRGDEKIEAVLVLTEFK